MPRSKKPSLRLRQGPVSVCNALDRIFSWEACPAGVSELLRVQIYFTIRCGMRRQVQRQAGPSPLSQGVRSRAWTATPTPIQASCSLARSGRPLSCFLRGRLLRSQPVQGPVGRLSRDSNLKPTESCADPVSELHTWITTNGDH